MAVIDILIAAAIVLSIVVGLFRGFVKEAVSLGALLFAIWAAMYFGPEVGTVSETWFRSDELQAWFGRVLVFAVVLTAGGLLGWALSKLVRLSILSGMDRFVGGIFGLARGLLLVGVFILGGQYAGFDNDDWWKSSKLVPELMIIAEWIAVMAPEGLDMLTQQGAAGSLPVDIPGSTDR